MNQRRMTSVEIQAYSVDEAVRLALEQLGLGEPDVDIEILSDAGPDEGDEALVRVTAKGMASQPIPRGARAGQSAAPRAGSHQGVVRERRQPGSRRVPGDRPSTRGAPPRERPRPAVAERPRNVDRIDEAEEKLAKEIVRELLGHMG
ncbi:MAG: Jag N-terminal domain-containing protein, partial [Thermomicrobiales bacterium]